MKANKSVLIFIQNGLGGAERVQIEIASMLLKDGWDVTFCMIGYENNNKIKRFYPDGTQQSEIIINTCGILWLTICLIVSVSFVYTDMISPWE